jgi:hypothetical protein
MRFHVGVAGAKLSIRRISEGVGLESPWKAGCGILLRELHSQGCSGRGWAPVGVFLPEAVLVETADRRLVPALCYVPPSRKHDAPDIPYVERILAAGREYGFPSWYLSKLETFLPRGAVPQAQQ